MGGTAKQNCLLGCYPYDMAKEIQGEKLEHFERVSSRNLYPALRGIRSIRETVQKRDIIDVYCLWSIVVEGSSYYII